MSSVISPLSACGSRADRRVGSMKMALILPDRVVYLTPKSPLHAMERGPDGRWSPPLRRVERGSGGEVNKAQRRRAPTGNLLLADRYS